MPLLGDSDSAGNGGADYAIDIEIHGPWLWVFERSQPVGNDDSTAELQLLFSRFSGSFVGQHERSCLIQKGARVSG